ncbi:MAG TPA: sigma-70 family RNA polymerase sigma factor [Frankiaceae bacterium]|nr:sigma-70 family RNA polymerase sigma factor [Frankiaceae bacterium]
MGAPPFQTFFAEHRDAVWRLLVATVGAQDADDCFQETWLAALRSWPPRETTNLRGWLFAIARSKAVDEHRARGRRPRAAAEVPDLAADPPPDVDPALWADVRRLPEKQRVAVVHRFVADLGYAEIAAVMGTSPEAARRNVHEGVTKLRQTWQSSPS